MKMGQNREITRYSRQYIMPEIGKAGQEILLSKKVAVIGLGALGTVAANNLARAGVGNLLLLDRDFVELTNLQRQVIFTEADVENRKPKAAAAKDYLSQVNSDIEIAAVIDDLNYGNIHKYLEGVDLIVDAADNFEVRLLINDYAHEQRIPWVYGAAIGTTGMTMPVVPGETPCLRCIVEKLPDPGSHPTCETAGVLSTTTGVIGNLETTEAIKILVSSSQVNNGLFTVDLWYNSFDRVELHPRDDCPVCSRGEYEFLQGKDSSEVTSLCGQNAVQVLPGREMTLDFKQLANTLTPLGAVQVTPFHLVFSTEGKEMVLFKNGRAMIKNVDSEQQAISFYTRYVGA